MCVQLKNDVILSFQMFQCFNYALVYLVVNSTGMFLRLAYSELQINSSFCDIKKTEKLLKSINLKVVN